MPELRQAFRATWYQLSHGRWFLSCLCLASLSATVGMLIEHRAAPALALTRGLQGPIFGLLFPLLAAAATRRTWPATGGDPAMKLARFGADRRRARLGSLLALLTWLMLAALLLGETAVLGLSPSASIPSASWQIGVGSQLAAIGYAGFFVMARSIGPRAIWFALATDWALNLLGRPLSIVVPRGHIATLLGGPPILQGQHYLALSIMVALALTGYAIALRRTAK